MTFTAARHRVTSAVAAAICVGSALAACSSGLGNGGTPAADASGALKVWARAANDSPKAFTTTAIFKRR